MRTIVAPVNFTSISANAARYAADLALATQAELHLYYVLQLPVTVAEFPVTDYVFEGMQEAGAQGLEELQKELIKRTSGKVNIFTHMEVGTVENKIEEFCGHKKPFVVVMGASGATLERALTGGNLVAAIRHLPYPLIVVPENAVFSQIHKIVLACDLNDISGGIPVKPAFLKELKDNFGASFEVLNVNTRGQQQETANIMEVDAWKDCIRETFPEVHFVQTDDVEEGIGKYLNEHPADMLLVFPKKHNFFEFHKSHAKKLAYNSTVPIMSIHA
ncbi:MAG TPA: universal stress protein [Puia sp.]|nr:universal stress protein [Puia sp.]